MASSKLVLNMNDRGHDWGGVIKNCAKVKSSLAPESLFQSLIDL